MDEMDTMEGEVEKTDAAATQGLEQLLAGLPKEPVDSATYNTLVDMTNALLEAFGGQTPFRAEPVEQDATAIGEGLGKAVVAFREFFEQAPEGAAYRFGIEDALADGPGMRDLAVSLGRAARDKKLVAAATGTSTTTPPPADKPAPKKTEKPKADDLMKED